MFNSDRDESRVGYTLDRHCSSRDGAIAFDWQSRAVVPGAIHRGLSGRAAPQVSRTVIRTPRDIVGIGYEIGYPVRDGNELYVVVRDQQGRVAHRAIGRAIVQADADASLTMLALRRGVEPLTTFCAYSPAQAEDARRTLSELGDVDFEDRDFDPEWFDPAACVAVIDDLLEYGGRRKRSLSAAVRSDLELLRRTLDEAARRCCKFYLAEVEPGEDLGFAEPELEAQAG